jgi:hypothetical protein
VRVHATTRDVAAYFEVSLALYTRRTVLNAAMLLRGSEVARQVRTYLLGAEAATVRGQQPAPASGSLEPCVANPRSYGDGSASPMAFAGYGVFRLSFCSCA